MALVHVNQTVGTVPTLLCTIPSGLPYTAVSIYNNDNQAIFLGDKTVTVNDGTTISTKAIASQIWLHSGDSLYAVSALGTSANAVSILYSGK